ncbi:hypothetical protein [Convivina praedatoris]|uniref:Uncharacterized protein n=1 Tax=Convivina praedatoris TaxID=2880963 RepID=A0ABN8H9E3_9LACO|nr:hypothetical protein [Convivina sp. LMG 32447]CAH1852207.1 hypothetical protein R077815_00516 [Convivina sp. LMG 32447]CAH1853721.1 hypothetical protein R078138_00714 [Convivina sp. LMG 32447]CAH1854351.1 hypothetical protein LMG032447_00848 [Convivina sp. LMG 32447]
MIISLIPIVLIIIIAFVIQLRVRDKDPEKFKRMNKYSGFIVVAVSIIAITANFLQNKNGLIDVIWLALLGPAIYLIRSN